MAFVVFFQVETIGDAYMVVGGVPIPVSSHAERVANFALGMIVASREVINPVTGGPIQVQWLNREMCNGRISPSIFTRALSQKWGADTMKNIQVHCIYWFSCTLQGCPSPDLKGCNPTREKTLSSLALVFCLGGQKKPRLDCTPQGLGFDNPDLNQCLYCLDPRGSPQRSSPGGCGWREDAPILSVRRHGQHSITYGEPQPPRSDPPEPDGLPVSAHAGLWIFTWERTFIAGQACASLCFVELWRIKATLSRSVERSRWRGKA